MNFKASIEIIQTEEHRERKKKPERNEPNFRDSEDDNERSNIYVTKVPEGKKKLWCKVSEDILAGNVPNLVKCTNLQIQEAQGTPKEGKLKENHTETHHNQTVEN